MTRVWEIEDSRHMPSDLVREQDFILRLRRLQRLEKPHLILNLVLSALEVMTKSRRALEATHLRLQEFSKITNGIFAEMSNGDVFIIWEETADAHLLSSRIQETLFKDSIDTENKDKYILTYHMPKDYVLLRERANHYIEVVRASTLKHDQGPSDILKSLSDHGPLTAWSVDQIGRLLHEIDLRRYGRTQPIYQILASGKFQIVREEYYVSFEDLKRERFPKIDIITPEHLFLALCELLDQRLLLLLLDQFDEARNRKLNFNLSVATVMGSVFAQFSHKIHPDRRGLVAFELHRGDLLQDFSRTLNAIHLLKREGFKVALDALTPDMLPYFNLSLFEVDYIKINVSKERSDLLMKSEVLQEIKKLPLEKVVFFRCDNERAFTIGKELGVQFFQGWYIEDLVNGGPMTQVARGV